MDKICIVVAHHDDEALMSAGLISMNKGSVHVVVVIDGREGQIKSFKENSIKFGFSYTELKQTPFKSTIQEVSRELAKIFLEHRFDLIVTHNPDDFHQEHKIVTKSTLIATRPVNGYVPNKLLFGFGVGSYSHCDSNYEPNLFYELSHDMVNDKVSMIDNYGSEIKGCRSSKGAIVESMMYGLEVCHEYSEAYHVYKENRKLK
jgi:LmbE family N-acetylglucosaminyl deacetylase